MSDENFNLSAIAIDGDTVTIKRRINDIESTLFVFNGIVAISMNSDNTGYAHVSVTVDPRRSESKLNLKNSRSDR